MKEYLGDIGYEIIDSMTVLSASIIGDEPENEIMKIMNNLTKAYQIDVLRTFGFDIPIGKNHKHTTLRGYEYCLEEINESDGIIVMDIYVPVARVKVQ